MPRSTLTTLLLAEAVEKYSDDQPRDDHGRWGGGESGSEKPGGSHAARVEGAARLSVAAHRATSTAQSSGKGMDHAHAAEAHRLAADAARHIGNKVGDTSAKFHEQYAKYHKDVSLGSKQTMPKSLQ